MDKINKIFLLLSVIRNIFGDIPLFEAYPKLKKNVPYVNLGTLPTPVTECKNLAFKINCKKLYIKNDGLIGGNKNGESLFGGSKVRKLEFLLADALNKNAKTVITFGCAGSNHALATACYCKQLGLKCLLMLKGQPNSDIVKRNLLLDLYYDAKLYYFPTSELREIGSKYKIFKRLEKDSVKPYVIPTGGSNPIGIIGFINAAFELKKQIESGLLQEPDYIYVPIGSYGTTVGLMIGLNAAGLKTKVTPVAVEPEEYDKAIFQLFIETVEFIKVLDPSFPLVNTSNFEPTNMSSSGSEYGEATKDGLDAIELVKKITNIQLDPTYSAKAMAGLINDAKQGKLKNKTVLFWNTFCDNDFEKQINKISYKSLPTGLHNYF
jgi:1-aminocyclopropane-1-carboxylate deaminase/D-cysteine desulfhydrase-like pyridoxal-dependent ACC family enzyme